MDMATAKSKVVGANYGNEDLISRESMTVGNGTGQVTVLPEPLNRDLRILGYRLQWEIQLGRGYYQRLFSHTG